MGVWKALFWLKLHIIEEKTPVPPGQTGTASTRDVRVRKTLTSSRCTRLTPRRGTLGTTQNTENTSGRGRVGRRGPASRAPVRDGTDGHRQGEKQWVTVNHDSVFWEARPDFGLLPRYPVEGC